MAVGDSAAHSEAMPKMALPSSSRRLKPNLIAKGAHRQHHAGHH